MSRYIRLTSKISLEDICDGKVSEINAYKSVITAWVLNPCRTLALNKNTDSGMAIWMLILSFFESHGQYLSGENSDRQSQKIFVSGFEAFKEFLIQKDIVDTKVRDLDIKKLYKFARNGLFHSLVMYEDFLIDCINFTSKPIAENPIHDGWLINPWLLIENLSNYVDFYIKQIKTNKKMRANFKKTFTRLILEPMKKMAKL